MIGKQVLQIGADQFISGMASSDYATDGALGVSSSGINPFVTPGVIRATAAPADISTNVAGNIIASCEDGQTILGYDRLFVDDAANYYTLSGSTITKRHTGSKTYAAGTTDIVSFAGYTYATSTTDMAQWNTSGTPSLTESWWVTTKGKSALGASNRHPLIVFEQLLWLADGNTLWFIDSGGTITQAAWTLSSNELITAFGIDPYTGLMLVAVTTAQNYSATASSKHYVYLYDGYSAKPRRKVLVDDMVTAFYNVGGTVYCGYGQRIGVWTGNGIAFLRKLLNVALSGTDLPYKHHFTHFGNVLCVLDGGTVLAYGEVVAGKKAWFPIAANPQGGSTHASSIANIGSNKISYAISSNKLYSFDMSSISAGSGTLSTANIFFQRPVNIHRMRVFTTGISATNQFGIGYSGYQDENTSSQSAAINTFVNQTGSTKYIFDFDFTRKSLACRFVIGMDTQGFGVCRILIYYDTAE